MKPSGRRDSSRVPRLASLPLSELLCVPLHSWCKQPSETATASHDKGILGLHWRQKIKELFHKHKLICLRKPLAVWFSDVVYVYNGSFNNCGEKNQVLEYFTAAFLLQLLKDLSWLKKNCPEQEYKYWESCINSTCTCSLGGMMSAV